MSENRHGRRYYKDVRLQQFRSFCETARLQSFSAAAARLGLSRPGVWQQVRGLEREYQTALVRRRGKRVELTGDGQLLLELIQPLVTSFESVRTLFQDRKQNLIHELRVAATANVLAVELRKPIEEFLDRYPRARLNLIDCPSSESLELLREDKLDLAVVSHLEEEPWDPSLEFDYLFARPFFLICPRRHELSRRRAIRLSDLVRYPMISGTKASRFRSRVDRVFERHGLLEKVHVVLETANTHVLAEYVSLGLGITVVPLALRRRDWPSLHFRSVVARFGEEQVLVAWKKGTSELPQVAGFRAIVREALGRRCP